MTDLVAISQRVAIDPNHGERRDALDQRWTAFLAACSLVPLALPNDRAAALALLDAVPVRGLVLTGGNSLAGYGGDAPERDGMELAALAWSRARHLPVLGVCRGMQVVLHAFGVALAPVAGHAGTGHALDNCRHVNSFHDFAARGHAGPLEVVARSGDGVIEAIRHPAEPIHAIMWHPERCPVVAADDISLFRRMFLGERP